MKKIELKHHIYALLILILIGYIGLIVLWRHQKAQINSLNAQVATLSANQAGSDGSNYTPVTFSPTDNSVYLPLAKLKLPATNLNENLVYSYTAAYTIPGETKVFPANLSVSTHDLAANAVSINQRFDCSEVAYTDFVTPSYPTNPNWKSDGKVKLSDGRTMNIYYAPAISGCRMAWKINKVNPKAIADSLRQASTY